MAGQVKGDQGLEDENPAREGGAEEDEKTRRRTPIDLVRSVDDLTYETCSSCRGERCTYNHVETCTERGTLVEVASSVAVEGVEQARNAVQPGAGARWNLLGSVTARGSVDARVQGDGIPWVEWHVPQRYNGENDASVANEVGSEQEDVLPLCRHRDIAVGEMMRL
jgi:hypothetical protein